VDNEGYSLGTFCIVDTRPHLFTQPKVNELVTLSAQAMRRIDFLSVIWALRLLSGEAALLQQSFVGSPIDDPVIAARPQHPARASGLNRNGGARSCRARASTPIFLSSPAIVLKGRSGRPCAARRGGL
jgi:hypothetical protein